METFVKGDKIKYPVLNIEYDTDTQIGNGHIVPIKIKSEDILKLDQPGGLIYLNLDEDTICATFVKVDHQLLFSLIQESPVEGDTIVLQFTYAGGVNISDAEYSNGLLSISGIYKESGFQVDFSTIYNGKHELLEEQQNNVKKSIGISTLTDDEILDILV